jgi:hypothetical protein
MTDKSVEQKFKDTATMLKQLHALRNITVDHISDICNAIEAYETELAHLSTMIVRTEQLEDSLRVGE